MRILGVFPAYEPAWAFGGVVRCTSNLFRAMAKLGVDVSVYTTSADGNGSLLPVPVGTPVNVGGVLVTYFKPTFGSGSVWDSRQLLHRLDNTISNFDIVYVSAIWQWIGISTGRLARKHKVPYVVGTHGSFDRVLLCCGRMKKMLYYQLFLKRCIQNATAIHFTTEYERHESEILYSGPMTFVVPNGLPPNAFWVDRSSAERLRAKFNIGHSVPLLLTAGRPDPKKRFDLLLRAFHTVCKWFGESQLMIVGQCDSAYSRKMKDLSRSLGLDKNVIWVGYIANNELKAFYAAADLFVLASMDENFGMVVTEAMACGLPVIVTNRIGVAEDVAHYDAGLVVEVNAENIAKAMSDLLYDHSRLRRMGENAKQAARRLYSDERVAKLMLKAFQDVLLQCRSPEYLWQ